MSQSVIPLIQREVVHALAKRGQREDGRTLEQFREIDCQVNPVGTADGSAWVKLGNTSVLVGVKLQTGIPYPDRPEEGMLMTGCELKPMAHPDFVLGVPSMEAVEVARVVDRGIRESGMLDFEALCMEPGESAWMLFVDIHVVNYDGNLFDAATMASVLALHNTVIPAAVHGQGGDMPLPVRGWPMSATVVKLGDTLLTDPTYVEEMVADARLTICLDDAGDVRAMQKGLSGGLVYDDVTRALEMTKSAVAGLRASLQESDRAARG